jgi:hypothetical protein
MVALSLWGGINSDNVLLVRNGLVKARDDGKDNKFYMPWYFRTAAGDLPTCLGAALPIGQDWMSSPVSACLAGWTQALLARNEKDRWQPAGFFAAAALNVPDSVRCREENGWSWFGGGWALRPTTDDITIQDAIDFLDQQMKIAQTGRAGT